MNEIRQTFAAFAATGLYRLEEFAHRREIWRKCLARLQDSEGSRQQHNRRMLMPCWKRMPTFYADRILLRLIPPVPWRWLRRIIVTGTGGGGKRQNPVLVARGLAVGARRFDAGQILLLAFGRKAAEEMDERIRERLHTE